MLPTTGEGQIRSRLLTAAWNARVQGWTTIILTAAFYGTRKPRGQQPRFLETVTSQLLQTQATVEETALLTEYLLRTNANNRVVVTGFSCGGACTIAAMGATLPLLKDEPQKYHRLAFAPLAGPASHSPYADGMLRSFIDLKTFADDSDFDDCSSTGRATAKINEDKIAKRLRQLMRDSEFTLHRMLQSLEQSGDSNTSKDSPTNNNSEMTSTLGRREPIRIGAVCIHAFLHDAFITEKYSLQALDNINQHVRGNKELESIRWLPGGHSIAAAMSPYFLCDIVARAVGEMDKSN